MTAENIMEAFAKTQALETQNRFNKILERVSSSANIADLNNESFASFIKTEVDTLIFFLDDPVRRPEAMDLAVLIPDIKTLCAKEVTCGFLRAESSRQLMPKYGINKLPCILLLRNSEYVGVIIGLKNWNEYQEEITALLAKPTSKAPSIGIAVTTIN